MIQTFDKEVKEKGLTPSTKVLTFKQEKAEEEVRQKLNLKETEKVYKLVRLRYVDDRPNVLVTTYVPCRLFEHLSEVDFEKESLYQTFHKEGRDITSIQRKLMRSLQMKHVRSVRCQKWRSFILFSFHRI